MLICFWNIFPFNMLSLRKLISVNETLLDKNHLFRDYTFIPYNTFIPNNTFDRKLRVSECPQFGLIFENMLEITWVY